jgi:anti-sigma factor RsiW
MTAVSRKIPAEKAGEEIEALLPWYAAGTLSSRDARRVEDALARDPGLAQRYETIREECRETIVLNESLAAPSPRAVQKLFAAIEAEAPHKPSAPLKSPVRIHRG